MVTKYEMPLDEFIEAVADTPCKWEGRVRIVVTNKQGTSNFYEIDNVKFNAEDQLLSIEVKK